jgi:hypothetical protein
MSEVIPPVRGIIGRVEHLQRETTSFGDEERTYEPDWIIASATLEWSDGTCRVEATITWEEPYVAGLVGVHDGHQRRLGRVSLSPVVGQPIVMRLEYDEQ